MEQRSIHNLNYDSDKEACEAMWPGLTFRDDYVFGAVLKSNLDVTRRLLECVLEIPIERVAVVTPQRASYPSQRAKSVRLDAYVQDGSGHVFDVEMQNYASQQLTKRARYYQSVMDTEQLDRGISYLDLPDTFVIFFCDSDPFGRGLKRYTYRQSCVEDGSFVPWDGSQKVYLNARGTQGEVNKELQAVLDYLAGHTIGEESLVRDIENTVAEVLSSEERRREFVDMQTKMMDEHRMGHDEGHEEGLAEGLEQGIKQGIQQGIEQGIQQGIEQGIQQGIEQGIQQGEERGRTEAVRKISQLAEALASADRQDELTAALADQNLLDALCKEFDIQ
ncbi:MAG: Rpn family recombination-promoting nuclease/putative transposase [Olegusella sp.]|jgi:predicted transposase/invertase (TIGR01784 family)|nr:Rpn family recombination-promoting nuclease/putative transposase [Olegusella sp.]